jgi:hypothetical protein
MSYILYLFETYLLTLPRTWPLFTTAICASNPLYCLHRLSIYNTLIRLVPKHPSIRLLRDLRSMCKCPTTMRSPAAVCNWGACIWLLFDTWQLVTISVQGSSHNSIPSYCFQFLCHNPIFGCCLQFMYKHLTQFDPKCCLQFLPKYPATILSPYF